MSQGANRLIDTRALARALRERWPDGYGGDRDTLLAEIRKIVGEHARPGALAPALTEVYRTGWAAGQLSAELAVDALAPAPGKASGGKASGGVDLTKKLGPDNRVERLYEYWGPGEGGTKKIRWNTDRDFTRCVRCLDKYMPRGQAEGMCAKLHKRMTGRWPGADRRDKGGGGT